MIQKLKRRAGALLAGACAMAVVGLTAASPAAASQETTRVVSLVPNLTELAFTIGAGAQVVGVSDYCRFPPEAMDRPAVGGLVNPSLEGVLQLRPTVVLLYRSQADFAMRLEQLGVATALFQVDTLADLYLAIDRLGEITGRRRNAAALSNTIRSELGAVQKNQPRDAVSGMVIVSRDPAGLRGLFQAGSGNFLGELFEIAGGNIAVPGGADVSLEQIIRTNPEVIIDMSGSASGADAGGSDGQTTTALRRDNGPWRALSTVRAVREGQVYQWNNPHSALLGPSVVETAWQMQRLLRAVQNVTRQQK